MKARYLGVPGAEDESPRRVEFAGVSFPRGLFVDVAHVAADRPKVHAKLAQNPSFEVKDEPLTKDEVSALEAVNGQSSADAAASAESAEPKDKAHVIAALESIQAKHPEVKFKPSDPVAKLRGILEAAQFEYGDDE